MFKFLSSYFPYMHISCILLGQDYDLVILNPLTGWSLREQAHKKLQCAVKMGSTFVLLLHLLLTDCKDGESHSAEL